MDRLHRALQRDVALYRNWHRTPMATIVHLWVLTIFVAYTVLTLTSEPVVVVATADYQIPPVSITSEYAVAKLDASDAISRDGVVAGVSTSAEAQITTQGVHVTIDNPVHGSTVVGEITVAVRAESSSDIISIEIRADDMLLGKCEDQSSCSIYWPVEALTSGSHSLSATAVNSEGGTGSVTIGVTK